MSKIWNRREGATTYWILPQNFCGTTNAVFADNTETSFIIAFYSNKSVSKWTFKNWYRFNLKYWIYSFDPLHIVRNWKWMAKN